MNSYKIRFMIVSVLLASSIIETSFDGLVDEVSDGLTESRGEGSVVDIDSYQMILHNLRSLVDSIQNSEQFIDVEMEDIDSIESICLQTRSMIGALSAMYDRGIISARIFLIDKLDELNDILLRVSALDNKSTFSENVREKLKDLRNVFLNVFIKDVKAELSILENKM